MAAEILARLLAANLAAAAAILLVIAARRPLRRLAGPRLAYAAWLIAPLAALASALPARVELVPVAPPSIQPDQFVTVLQPATTAAAPFDPAQLLFALWIAGAAVGLLILALLQWRSLRKLGPLSPAQGQPRTLVARTTGFGPAVVGALYPRIVLPADFDHRFAPNERAVVLAHERVHLAAGDAQVNALLALCQCLNWFNPLVHIAAHLVRIDQELACDAAVMARYPEARRSYAEAMLKTQLAPAPLPLGCYWPARSENPLKERLAMLKTPSPGKVRRLAGACAIGLLAGATAYGAWAAQPPRQKLDWPQPQPAVATAPAAPQAAAADPAPAAPARTYITPPPSPPGAPDLSHLGRMVIMAATVERVQLTNPNSSITVKAQDGTLWTLSAGPAMDLIGKGVTRDLLPYGAPVFAEMKVAAGETCTGLCEAQGVTLIIAGADSPDRGLRIALAEGVPNPLPMTPPPADKPTGPPQVLNGVIEDVRWENPSTIIRLTDDQGRAWTLSGPSPNAMLRTGVSREALAPGTRRLVRFAPTGDLACTEGCTGNLLGFPASKTE